MNTSFSTYLVEIIQSNIHCTNRRFSTKIVILERLLLSMSLFSGNGSTKGDVSFVRFYLRFMNMKHLLNTIMLFAKSVI